MTRTRNFLISMVMISVICIMQISGTSAYLQSTSDTLVNVFVYGKIQVRVDEAKVDSKGLALKDGSRTMQNTYDLSLFGKEGTGEVDKDPTVTVLEGSDDCYIFMALDNRLPDCFTLNYDTDNWIKVAEKETMALYAYHKVIETDVDEDTVLEPLFTKVSCSKKISEKKMIELNDSTVNLTAYAIQKEDFTEKSAIESALAALSSLENNPYSLSKDDIVTEEFLDEVK